MLNFIQNKRIIQVTLGRNYKSFIFIIFLNVTSLFGQNLVPNPSFEDTVYCPLGTAEPNAVANWFNPTQASPDYYNVCSQGGAGVPVNDWGYQYAQEGDAYIGIGSFWNSLSEYREYFEVELSEELEAGRKYFWCLYVSSIDSIDFDSNNLGISLSSTLIQSPTQTIMNSIVYGNHTSIIDNSEGWLKIGGEFDAIGGEKYLIVGNFFSDNQTSYVQKNTNSIGGEGAAWFIDNVFLGETPCDDQEYLIPNVFTPNQDGINDQFSLEFDFEFIQIYNRWGLLIFESNDADIAWNGKYQGKDVSEGNYYYLIKTKNDLFKGFVQVIR